jgi:hypothetical protein
VPVVTFVLVTGHLLRVTGWLGAMAYSLAVVQPRVPLVRRVAGGERGARDLPGRRRPAEVVGLIARLAATGGLLVALGAASRQRGATWWALVGTKATLLVLASGDFWYVSWRIWPRRLFALPGEVAG